MNVNNQSDSLLWLRFWRTSSERSVYSLSLNWILRFDKRIGHQ